MITTFIITFREFLEVFLIIGVFLGISKKLKLKREKEILIASLVGIVVSLLLPISVFLIGSRAGTILTEKNADLLGGYLMIFSGFFIAYVIFSLHNLFVLKRSKAILYAHEKLRRNTCLPAGMVFDLSLFLTIVFFILREGFEVALFTATASLFTSFIDNMSGLFLGFLGSSLMGLLTFVTYIKFSIGRVFKMTEYLIVILGAALVKNGLAQLLEIYFKINLAKIVPINFSYLPTTETFAGHLLQNLFGIERQFSLAKLAIIAAYIFVIYFFLIKKPKLQKTL